MWKLSRLASRPTSPSRHVLTCLLLALSFVVGGFVADYFPAVSRGRVDFQSADIQSAGAAAVDTESAGQQLVNVEDYRK